MDQMQMFEQLSSRFTKVEEKVDKLSETVVTLARVEERQVGQNDAITRIGKALDKQDSRIEEVEEDVNLLKQTHAEQKPTFGMLKFAGAAGAGALIAKLAEKLIT